MALEAAAEDSFAALLRRYRRAAGLTQAQVAERANLSERAVSDLERDDGRVPRRDTLHLLARALDLSGPERAALEQAIRRARSHALRATTAAPASPEGPGSEVRLPAKPTAFIGREAEIAAVSARLLDPATRLLTLLGPGGVGKTRLALQVAEAAGPQFPDGVTFIGLAALSDPALVFPATAQALGVREVAGQTIAKTLATALGHKRLLLVLDNFEQVSAAAGTVQELLAAVPGLTVLTTSRAALRIRGEQLHQVVPLSVPRPPLPPLAALSQYEAVRLFIARAQDVRPDFTVTNETAPAVATFPLALTPASAATNPARGDGCRGDPGAETPAGQCSPDRRVHRRPAREGGLRAPAGAGARAHPAPGAGKPPPAGPGSGRARAAPAYGPLRPLRAARAGWSRPS